MTKIYRFVRRGQSRGSALSYVAPMRIILEVVGTASSQLDFSTTVGARQVCEPRPQSKIPVNTTANKRPSGRSICLKVQDYRHPAPGLSLFTIAPLFNIQGARQRRNGQRFLTQHSQIAVLSLVLVQDLVTIGRGSNTRLASTAPFYVHWCYRLRARLEYSPSPTAHI